jgi:tRNA threonylcarbamoyladenosine modification (KEOPS) complex  Pcc1 subunit
VDSEEEMLCFELKLFLLSEEKAEAVRRAVSMELENRFEKRSSTRIAREKNCILLSTTASDKTALKASFNSYARLIFFSNQLGGN